MPCGDHLFSGHDDRTVRKWNFSGDCLAVMRGHTDIVWCLVIFDGSLFSGSFDCTVRKWTLDGKAQQLYEGHTAAVLCLTVWNNTLFSASRDYSMIQWTGDSLFDEDSWEIVVNEFVHLIN